jgi:uncharacterized protein YggE
MIRIALVPASLLVAASLAVAQAPNSVQATGNATRAVKPDMAQLNIGVVTQAATAQAAADQNATITDAVTKALQGILSSAGTIQTLYYSINPRYVTSGGQQTLSGYVVTNTVQVTTTIVGRVGPLIDAANAAGANSISGPYFGLQNPDPEVQLALNAASKEALAHASAIAAGLGAKTGAVISAQEGSTVRPIVSGDMAGPATNVATPIQTGTVNVSATVTVTVALVQ